MARPRRSIECPRDPVGLSAPEAAAFVGVSETMFRDAVTKGLFPAPRELFGRVLWDAEEVYAAFRRLPRKGETRQDDFSGVDWSRPAA
jgi:predicted DNA-binding transcriptional regulator AlpA